MYRKIPEQAFFQRESQHCSQHPAFSSASSEYLCRQHATLCASAGLPSAWGGEFGVQQTTSSCSTKMVVILDKIHQVNVIYLMHYNLVHAFLQPSNNSSCNQYIYTYPCTSNISHLTSPPLAASPWLSAWPFFLVCLLNEPWPQTTSPTHLQNK